MRTPLPQLSGRPVVNDGGLETDLIYHYSADLPDFAAFPLVDDERGRELLSHYYSEYVEIARRAALRCSSTRRPGGRAPIGATGWATRFKRSGG